VFVCKFDDSKEKKLCVLHREVSHCKINIQKNPWLFEDVMIMVLTKAQKSFAFSSSEEKPPKYDLMEMDIDLKDSSFNDSRII